jgi:hypothetical protein
LSKSWQGSESWQGFEQELAGERELAEEQELAEDSAAATHEWSEEVEREELAELVKRCPICISSNPQPEKDEFSKLTRCISCHTVH